MMRPSGPGVEVTNPCLGGAAFARLMGIESPKNKTVVTTRLASRAKRIFIGGDYISKHSR
jgi:hypothetical protein